MGFFDWFRRSKPDGKVKPYVISGVSPSQLATAEEYLSLKSNEFPWPKDRLAPLADGIGRRTNHIRGAAHWTHSSCLGSEKKALEIDFMQSEWCIVDEETGALMPPALVKYGVCPSCGRKGRVTNSDKVYNHLPASIGS